MKKKVEPQVETKNKIQIPTYDIKGPIDWEFMKPIREEREKMCDRILKNRRDRDEN